MMHNKPMLHSTTHPTPVGTLTLVASYRGLRAVVWPKSSRKGTGVNGRPHRNPDHPILKTTARQLDEYFSGERSTFDIPLDLEGTRFQVAAWRSLAQIPFGSTTTYGRQAAGLGIPTAARAVAGRWRASRARPRSGDRRPANPSEAGGGAPGRHARHGTPGRRKPAHLRPLLRYSA